MLNSVALLGTNEGRDALRKADERAHAMANADDGDGADSEGFLSKLCTLLLGVGSNEAWRILCAIKLPLACLIVSFYCGMVVFGTTAFCPYRSVFLLLALVYINIFADVVGFKLFVQGTTPGRPPPTFRPHATALLSALRLAGLVGWLVYIGSANGQRQGNATIGSEVGVLLCQAVFCGIGGWLCPHAYIGACQLGGGGRLGGRSQRAAGVIVQLGIFFGLYCAFVTNRELMRVWLPQLPGWKDTPNGKCDIKWQGMSLPGMLPMTGHATVQT